MVRRPTICRYQMLEARQSLTAHSLGGYRSSSDKRDGPMLETLKRLNAGTIH